MQAPPPPSPVTGIDPSKPPAEQAWDLFKQAVRVILAQWTTLSLAVTNEWGGGNSKQKAEQMMSCLLDEFNDVRLGKAKEVEVSEIEEFLYMSLEEEFQMQVEDSSVEQVSKLLLMHFAHCLKGNFAPVLALLASYKPPPVEKSVKGAKPAPSPSSTADLTPAPAQPTPAPAVQPSPDPATTPAPSSDVKMDEEWTEVPTRKGRRGGKK